MSRLARILLGLSALAILCLSVLVVRYHNAIDDLELQLLTESASVQIGRSSAEFCRESVRQIPVGEYMAQNGDKIVVEPVDCCDGAWNTTTLHYGPTHRNIPHLSMIEIQLLEVLPGWPRNYEEYAAQFQVPLPRMIGL